MNMRPDRQDYETWIIDYLDGNLDDDQVRELFSFLLDNPDIMEEFNELLGDPVFLNRVEFPDKNSLKKTVHELSENQFEMLCVAHLENDLSAEQQDELNEIITADAGRRERFTLINKTKLVAPLITYPYKKELYRLTIVQKGGRIAVAAMGLAATLLLLVTLFIKSPEITGSAESIAVADSLSETVSEDNPGDTVVVKKAFVPPVQEKRRVNDIKPVLAENSVVRDEGDSVIKAIVPEVRKAEFRQEVAIASFSEPAGLTVTSGTNTIVTDFYTTQPEEETRSVARLIRDRIRRDESSEKEKITAFDVADAGINGLNRIFGWDISLEKKTDNDGTVKSVNFNSKLLKVQAPVKKSEPVE